MDTDRISDVNPKTDAVVKLLDEDASKGADAAGKVVAGDVALRQLCGVLFSGNDALSTAGVLTRHSSRLLSATFR